MERFQGVATKYLDNYLYWFRWLELGKNLALEKQVEQMLISACKKPNDTTVESIRRFEMQGIKVVNVELINVV